MSRSGAWFVVVVLLLGWVGTWQAMVSAGAPVPQPKDEPKKETPKPPGVDGLPAPPGVPDLFPNPPPGVDPALMKRMMEQYREQMRRMRQNLPPGAIPPFPFGGGEDARFGARFEKPNAT